MSAGHRARPGLLGQVEGRTADDAAYWLAQAPAAWRDAVQVVAIDICSIYASAVRRMPPAAQIVVDLFHLVQLAVKATGDVRRRAVREKYGRRGRPGDPEYAVKGLLVRNLEHLSAGQFAKVMGALSGDQHGQEIAADWIAKEKLRDVLNLRARINRSNPLRAGGPRPAVHLLCLVRPERRHPRTGHPRPHHLPVGGPERRRGPVLTGVTNARSESLNRIAKLEARQAYSFCNPANQRHRVRTACTRGRSRGAASRRSAW
jgi:transposase